MFTEHINDITGHFVTQSSAQQKKQAASNDKKTDNEHKALRRSQARPTEQNFIHKIYLT